MTELRELERALSAVEAEARSAVEAAARPEELEALRLRYLGKKGRLTALKREVGRLPAELRPEFGRMVNRASAAIEAMLASRLEALARDETARRLEAERLDVTFPGRPWPRGHLHPVYQVWEAIEAIFVAMGFDVAEGPQVEWDDYNFVALNIPKDHPARDMQQSFYVAGEMLLRTQTSPVQIRYMRARCPELPIRMIAPGRVFRRDDDATHSPMFHQVEGLVVDRGISLGDLKGCLDLFAREMFGAAARTRFRPSYFPFTEPSAEVDVSCTVCGGTGCRTCGYSGWLEILGAGMVHPQVLANGGYDPEEVTGFAFGMGIERIAMLRYGVDDLRLFFGNDLRFLEQF